MYIYVCIYTVAYVPLLIQQNSVKDKADVF